MSKQSQLPSTIIQQRNKDHRYFDFASLIKPYGFDRIDDLFTDVRVTNEAMIQPFHSDEYEANRKAPAAAAATLTEEDEEKQVHKTTYSNPHSSKEQTIRRSKGTANLSIDIWKSSRELTPNYSNISKQRFKNLLCQANLSNHQQLRQSLLNPRLLSFVQKYAHLISMRIQLEMEKDYWKHIIDRLLFAVQWLSKMPKNLTKQYSINWDYPRTENNIRHRQKLTENKLKKIHQQLQVHLQKYSSCCLISDKTPMDQTMHMISNALRVMIEHDLQNLHIRFEQKKSLIQYDAYDIHLLKLFTSLHPTEDQKIRAQKIWRGKRKHGERQIHLMKTSLFNNEADNTSIILNENNQQDHTDQDHEEYQIPFFESFDLTMRTIIETRHANIANRTQQIISFQSTISSV